MNLGYLITGQCPKDYSPTVEVNKAIPRIVFYLTCEVFGSSGLLERKICLHYILFLCGFNVYFLLLQSSTWDMRIWQLVTFLKEEKH